MSEIRERFPALGLQVPRHQPPTQEKNWAVPSLSVGMAFGTQVACESVARRPVI